ncbi:MAG: int, partial [Paenibacillus sp.]|nr:int [Paenibacillus sp.]
DIPMFRQSHVEHLVKEYIEKIKMDQTAVQEEQNKLQKKTDNQQKEVSRLRRDLDKIKARMKKWQYAFAEDIISAEDLRKRMAEEATVEAAILAKLEILTENNDQPSDDRLYELIDLWSHMDDVEKQNAIGTIFDKITLFTDEVNVKGVKNAFFPANVTIKYK